ncbi:MAG: autotransporter domain-containing protein [Parachlamydiaceae bacterium]
MKFKALSKFTLTMLCAFHSYSIEAIIWNVTSASDSNNSGTLTYAIINAQNSDTIDCSAINGQTVVLNRSLPALTQSVNILGSGITINGQNLWQAFSVAQGTVSINDVTVTNAISKGGDGGGAGYGGGGGGVGGGGAIYIQSGASLVLSTSALVNNQAIGGNGGSSTSGTGTSGGGGGGFGGGNGGSSPDGTPASGGGGGHSNGGPGGYSAVGGDGLYFGGGGGGGINSMGDGFAGGSAGLGTLLGPFMGGSGSSGASGGGAGINQDGVLGEATQGGGGGSGIGADTFFGGGGGGCGMGGDSSGGNGYGAGGGGGGDFWGGNGGILGGGGGGGYLAGNGGFGAGGGGTDDYGEGGLGGFGGGSGSGNVEPDGHFGGGGGGAGFGGAIFVQTGAALTIQDSQQISGNSSLGGVGGAGTSSLATGMNGMAMGKDIFLRAGGTIIFDLENTLSLNNPIEGDQTGGPNGSGGVTKTGGGVLQLNGANTYSGLTTVDQGTLKLNGSVVGNALINEGGVFSGNATVAGNIINSGIIAPGNSIGTINTTNLYLQPTSLLKMEVSSAGNADQIVASGVAQLDGTLDVIPLSGNYTAPQTYTIITAPGGVSGIFLSLESSSPTLLHVTYDPSDVKVKVLPISAIGLSHNALKAANCYLGGPYAAGSDVDVVSASLLTLDFSGLDAAFNQMQPSHLSALAWTQFENALLVRSSYSQHLEQIACDDACDRFHVWADGLGQWQQQASKGCQYGYNASTGGVTFGVDSNFSEYRLGAAVSYTGTKLKWNQSAGNANLNSYYGGLYSSWSDDSGYINASLLGGYTQYRSSRHLHFSEIDRDAKATHNGWEALVGMEAGINWCNECVDIIPFIRIDYIYQAQQGYQEGGAASLNLDIEKHNDQLFQSEFGVVFTKRHICDSWCESGTFVPRLKLSYINQSPLTGRSLHANFTESPCDFSVTGQRFMRNLGAASLGLTYFNCGETIGITVRYDGQCGSDYWNQSCTIALDMKF